MVQERTLPPTGSEIQEEIHKATVERVLITIITLATSGLPHTLILINILINILYTPLNGD